MSATSITLRSTGLAIMLALTCGSGAHAAIVSYDLETASFRYSAVKGERNELKMEYTIKGRLVIHDAGANIVGTDRCVRPEPDNWHYVVCRVRPKKVRVSLGNERDTAMLHLTPLKSTLVAYGGAGNDDIAVNIKKRTWLYGQDGMDVLNDGNASGYLSGGDGLDTLVGHEGSDTLVGGAGPDLLFGGEGKDVLDARDLAKDGWIDCGAGIDKAQADTSEQALPINCETIAGTFLQGQDGSS